MPPIYIHELKEWPNFTWSEEQLLPLIDEAGIQLDALSEELKNLGFTDQSEASLRTLTEDVVRTSEIEGETLDPFNVRSSIARRLGLPQGGVQTEIKEDRSVEGIVAVILDATTKCDEPLTEDRLYTWHSSLFPTGRSGGFKIPVAQWRDDRNGPMVVSSGPEGHQKIHFQAPDFMRLPSEMQRFIEWFENQSDLNPLIKAGIAHLYFVTIHPFADGNGRIARAIADLELARADHLRQRYYSMSAQIVIEKNVYYDTLERTQRETLDVTRWLDWFLNCLIRAVKRAEKVLQDILQKARIWQFLENHEINERQRKVLNLMLDGDFYGALSTDKYSKMTKTSLDTANRDLKQLVDYGVMERSGRGKATRYTLKPIE